MFASCSVNTQTVKMNNQGGTSVEAADMCRSGQTDSFQRSSLNTWQPPFPSQPHLVHDEPVLGARMLNLCPLELLEEQLVQDCHQQVQDLKTQDKEC